MPLKAPVAVPVWTWTGLYLGINAGWGEAKSSWCTEATLVTGCAGTDLVSQTGNSSVGGVQVEARYQWGNVVFGLGGDASLFNNSATSPAALPAGFPNRLAHDVVQRPLFGIWPTRIFARERAALRQGRLGRRRNEV